MLDMNVNVNPLGDWTTQAQNPNALRESLGFGVVERMAAAGDGEAQFSMGCFLFSDAVKDFEDAGAEGLIGGAGGRTPQAEVSTIYISICMGWTLNHRHFHQLTRPRCVERCRCGHLSTKQFVCW